MELNLDRVQLAEATEEEEDHHHRLVGQEGSAQAIIAGAGDVADQRRREHMFDKVVTPSDVGKLNRLVVPKQHAERFFPAAVSGTQLRFEDRAGMPWLFRYSYWGSSQSYVMTKGWSRFVRAAGLAAGDTVSFSRGAGGHYFIDYRHFRTRRRCRDISFGSSTAAAAASMPAWPLLHRVEETAMPPASHRRMASVTAAATGGARSFRLFGVNVECGGGGADAAAVAVEEEDDVDGDRRGEEREMAMWRRRS